MVLQARYDSFGDPADVLHLNETEAQAPGEGQARIQVLRAPINPSDLIQVAGNYGVKPELPAVAGNEGLGRIAEVGAGVGHVKPGDLVLLPAGCGTWQSEVVADAATLFALPEADLDQLSMLTVNPPTAYLLLQDFVDLHEGDWIIQSAANSAVGRYVIQLAAQRGIRTVNVVRRAELAAELEELGADVVLVDGEDLPQRVADAVGEGRIRLGLDAVSGGTFARMSECLAPGGVMVSYGAMSNMPAMLSPQAVIFRDVQVRGFWLARWFTQASPARKQEVFGALIGLIAQGKLSAAVDAVYPLSALSDAVAHAARDGRGGKVLLAPSEGV
ncbi:Quinone oxidoreductase 1 [Pseudoruegeria aquimaris]|uniref:enoyl-[acyl-carrier-protein] reductase n=1 Tax=Pseudoruegeria aquimaris TaxID=393663 RepID=A0A1Y5SDX8_9RHOB|nr:zinc-dependent alcohol dehydrogenase family protein [Pseudoruegeria aquimaris]SLN35780.1 Quinone oxidoreductase 1 [Pseudoruegeria aquimaris]